MRLPPVEGVAFRVEVIEGQSVGTGYEIRPNDPQRVLFGKSPACQIRLDDPLVSRRHAALDVTGAGLRLVDLDSTNGTTVNGVRVGSAILNGGERVQLGSTVLSVGRAKETRDDGSISELVGFGPIVGKSVAMRRLFPLCQRLAESDVSVVIEGETGTGKERLAEALHERSRRAEQPFCVLDCTAIPPNLFESELFGHEKGAFTGATSRRRGVFERAHGGTLLIDEVGDLPLDLQPKLLRVLERSEVTTVGGERVIRVDVRVLAATRRDLDQEVTQGRFRDDLFHRLAVARVELPPLRERRGDVALLAEHFWEAAGGRAEDLSPELLARWESYAWPGNVRELRNAVARRLALGELAEVDWTSSGPARAPAAMAGDVIGQILAMDLPLPEARNRLVSLFEARYLDHAVWQHGGVARAAAGSGVAKRHFQRLRAKYRQGEED